MPPRLILPAPDPGVYAGVPFSTYTAWDAASNTALGKLLRSPAHAKAYLEGYDEDTEAKRLGRPIHCAVFEAEAFDDRYVVAQQCACLTDKGKGPQCSNPGLWVDSDLGWVCGVHGKGRGSKRVPNAGELITAEERDLCFAIGDRVHASEAAAAILAPPCEFELSIVWVDPETGVTCKGRLDAYNEEHAGGTIADGKSTEDAREAAFERTIFTFGYHRQAAFYLAGARAVGLPAEHFALIPFEKKPPHGVGVFRMRDDVIAATSRQTRALLELYARCKATDSWPCYPDEVRDIAVPVWAWSQIEQQTHEILKRAAA